MEIKYRDDYEYAKSKSSSYLEDCRKWRKYYIGELWDDISVKNPDAYQPEINYIRPNVQQLLAMLQLKHPTITAEPREMTDSPTAGIISKVISTIYDNNNVAETIRLATLDKLIYDRGYVGAAWNNEKQTIEFFVISPFNIFIDPLGRTLDEAEYCHVTHLRSERYVKDKYGVDLKNNDRDEFTDADGIMLIESWYKPSKEYPNGKHYIWTYASDKPLIEDEGTYPTLNKINMFPIVEFLGDNTSTGEKRSMVADMWAVQEMYQKFMGYLADNVMLTQNAQYIGIGDKSQFPETIPNTPGAVHTFISELKPLQTPQLSPSWQNMVLMLQNLFPDISGVRQVNYGSTSSGVTAASAIVALQEAGKTIKELKEDGVIYAAKGIGKICVAMMDDFFTEEIWKRYTGMVPTEENMSLIYDIGLEYSEALPQDKTTRINVGSNMVNMKVLDAIGFGELLGDPVLSAKIAESQKRMQEAAAQAQAMQMQMQGQTQQLPIEQPTEGMNG